ncbi:MAG: VanW family protein [Solirubrobacteraceae bacterium]|nr:VanW family protein [Solirubrobacteraceae bacterium]
MTARRPDRTRPPVRRSRRGPLLAVLGGVVAVIVVLLVIGARYDDKALPGTTVAGVDLGGADAAEIERRLKPVIGGDEPVTLAAGRTTISVRPSDAGYRVDLGATAQEAIDAGRSGPLGTVRGVATGTVGGREVEPVARIDQAQLLARVRTVAKEVDRPISAGAIAVSPETLTARVTPPTDGRRVRRDELADRLERALGGRRGGTVAVPVTQRKAVSSEKVAEIGQQAEAYLREPLRLSVKGAEPLTVSPAQLAPVLALRPLEGGRDARLGTDPQARTALVATLAEQRDRPARDAKFTATGGDVVLDGKDEVTWKPRSAEVEIESEGRAGRAVQQSEAADRIDSAVRAGRHEATLPVATVASSVSAGQAAEIDQLIGTFTTHYIPGQPRVTNIRKIAATVDGTVIGPGKTFSLNDVAGERTTEKGYVEAPFIAEGNKLEPSVGGGVSQFSTTMYNAAYFAGLQLDAHTAHSLYIDRYPAGRESTLNWGSIDLRWTNDTKVPILIRTSSDEDSVTVRLYGDNGGRRVTALPGPREPVDGGDFAITVTRVITLPDGQKQRQPVTTSYQLHPEGE